MFRIILLANFFAEVSSQTVHTYPLQPQLISQGPRNAGKHGILLEHFPTLAEEGHPSGNSDWHLGWHFVTLSAGPVYDTAYAHLPTSSLRL